MHHNHTYSHCLLSPSFYSCEPPSSQQFPAFTPWSIVGQCLAEYTHLLHLQVLCKGPQLMCAHVYNSHGHAKSRREHFIALYLKPCSFGSHSLSAFHNVPWALEGDDVSLVLAQGRILNCHLFSALWGGLYLGKETALIFGLQKMTFLSSEPDSVGSGATYRLSSLPLHSWLST